MVKHTVYVHFMLSICLTIVSQNVMKGIFAKILNILSFASHCFCRSHPAWLYVVRDRQWRIPHETDTGALLGAAYEWPKNHVICKRVAAAAS